MPIEIRELVIKAAVGARETEQQSDRDENMEKHEENNRDCIEQMAEITMRKAER